MQVYLFDSNTKVGVSQGLIVVCELNSGEKITTYPIGTVEGVSIFGKPSLSTAFLREMLKRNIPVGFYSATAHYYGRLSNPETISAPKQRLQAVMGLDEKFALSLSKQFVRAKLSNSLCLLREYNKSLPLAEIEVFENAMRDVQNARSAEQILGFEGTAAKRYFKCLGEILPEEFKFRARSTRPPLDPFNSMISFGYSMLYRNIIGAIDMHGLNPYFGFMHQDREKHATLASDLMEEWRAIIVDDTVLKLILQGDVCGADFEYDPKNGACTANRETFTKIIKAFASKLATPEDYLEYDDKRYTFQDALDLQLYRLHRAIESDDATYYRPVTADATIVRGALKQASILRTTKLLKL